jgi:hypothetical protein
MSYYIYTSGYTQITLPSAFIDHTSLARLYLFPMILGTTVIFVIGTQYFLCEMGSEFSSIFQFNFRLQGVTFETDK